MRANLGFGFMGLPSTLADKARTLLTKQALTDYLSSPDAPPSFKCRDGLACPIATYLNKDTPEYEHMAFNPTASDAATSPVPPWGITFGKLVDAEPTDTITPARALELLASIPD